MSTIILQVDEYEELVRACEKAEARVEELEDLITSVTPNKDAEGIILNAKRRLGGEPGDSLIQLCIKAKYDCDRYLAALEWQPIETAPKDGTPVLLHETGNVFTGKFAWCEWWDKYDNAKDPTDWMPFPDPPKA